MTGQPAQTETGFALGDAASRFRLSRLRRHVRVTVDAGPAMLDAMIVLFRDGYETPLLVTPVVAAPGRSVDVVYDLSEDLLAEEGRIRALLEVEGATVAARVRRIGGKIASALLERIEGTRAIGWVARDDGSGGAPMLSARIDSVSVSIGAPVFEPLRRRFPAEPKAMPFSVSLPATLFDGAPHDVALFVEDEPVDGVGPIFVDDAAVRALADPRGRILLSTEGRECVSLAAGTTAASRILLPRDRAPIEAGAGADLGSISRPGCAAAAVFGPQAALVPVVARIEAVERAVRLVACDDRIDPRERHRLCEVELPAVLTTLRATLAAARRSGDVSALSTVMRARPAPAHERTEGVTIVVPVYGGRDETVACLEALAASDLPDDTRVLVIDDASPDPVLSRLVEAACARAGFEHRRNPRNLGFVGTVNRGLSLERTRDVVLLNADAIVPPGFLQRLAAVASAGARVATVTPFSNAGWFVSYPRRDVETSGIDRDEVLRLDRLFGTLNAGRVVELPSGVGFCLYVTRAALDAVGLLDPVFGRGYGEENDFCLRASAMGFTHLVACDTFVGHVGAASFGDDKHALVEAHRPLLVERYPDYPDRLRRVSQIDPLAPHRRRVDVARLAETGGFSLSVPGAGADAQAAAVADAAAERQAGRPAAVLRRASEGSDPWYEIDVVAPDLLIRFRLSEALDVLEALVGAGLGRIVLHGIVGLDLALLEPLYACTAHLELVAHDHALVCPRVSCTRSDGRFCGGPQPVRCETCLAVDGPDERLHGFADLIATAAEWRSLGLDLAGQADGVRAASAAIAEDLSAHLGLAITTMDVARDPRPPAGTAGPPYRRVLVADAMSEPRHARTLAALARDAAARGRDVVFVVAVPSGTRDPLLDGLADHPSIEWHSALIWPPPNPVEALGIDAGLIVDPGPGASVRALRAMWRAGLPVVARGPGTPAALLREHGGGIVLDTDVDSAQIVDVLTGVAPVPAPAEGAPVPGLVGKAPRRRSRKAS